MNWASAACSIQGGEMGLLEHILCFLICDQAEGTQPSPCLLPKGRRLEGSSAQITPL